MPSPQPYGPTPPFPRSASRYPVHQSYLLAFGFDNIPILNRNYDSYDNFLSNNKRKQIAQRGFLSGIKAEFPTTLTTEGPLHFGSYMVLNVDGYVVARATATAHISTPCSNAKYRQYNPCGYPAVADMANVSTRPWTMSHHFALSHVPRAGMYKLVGLMENGSMSTNTIWVENARCVTRLMDELDHERADKFQHPRDYYSKPIHKIKQAELVFCVKKKPQIYFYIAGRYRNRFRQPHH